MGKEEYGRYLASREWSFKKAMIYKRCECICERCIMARADCVHHLTYENIYHEKPEDLIAVCSACHDFLHAKSEIDPKLIEHPFKDIVKFTDDYFPSSIKCPAYMCGFDFVHFEQPYEIPSDDYSAWSGRGSCTVIPGWCEDGHRFELCIGFHKGVSSIFFRNITHGGLDDIINITKEVMNKILNK